MLISCILGVPPSRMLPLGEILICVMLIYSLCIRWDLNSHPILIGRLILLIIPLDSCRLFSPSLYIQIIHHSPRPAGRLFPFVYWCKKQQMILLLKNCGPGGNRTLVLRKWFHCKLYYHSLLKSAFSLGNISYNMPPPPPCLTNRETSVTIMFLGQSPTSCRAITQQHVQQMFYCLLFSCNVGRYHPDSCN